MTTPIPNDLPTDGGHARAPREPLAFVEWWDDLLWPRVLGGAGLGLRPNRLGVAFFLVIVTSVLLGMGEWLDAKLMKGPAAEALNEQGFAFWLLNPWTAVVSLIHSFALHGPVQPGFANLPWRLFLAGPAYLARNWPVSTLIMGPLAVFCWAVAVGAIARMTAVEIARGTRITWVEGLGFSLRRWRSLMAAVLAPLMVIWVIALIGAVFGFLLLHWPVVNIVGAIAYGLVLALSVLAALAAGGYLLGLPLLPSAIVCEGTDSIDAMQRAFAYVTGRLPRLLLYLALASIGVAFVTGVIGLLAGWSITFAASAAASWAGDSAQPMFGAGQPLTLDTPAGGDATGTYRIAGGLITFWNSIPIALIAATCVASAASASAMLYLAMRQICDGQDIAELWTEGIVEGAMAEALESRGEITRQTLADSPRVVPPPDNPD